MFNLKKDIEQNCQSFIVIAKSTEISQIISYAAQNHQRICYVSFQQPYYDFLLFCKTNKINPPKFFFIDCITKTVVKKPKKEEKVIFISKPTAYDEIKKTIWKVLQEEKYGLLIFDSLSDILIYEQEMKTLMFLHSLTATIKGQGCPVLFILHSEDTEKETIKQLGMMVDKTIEL